MKNLLPLLIILVSPIFSAAQITFEAGYIVTKDSTRTACLVKNADWENNPSEISYKLTEAGSVFIGKIQDIAEFGIGTESRFRRFTVEIDQSAEASGRLSLVKEPEYETRQVFLKVLAAGKATLYKFKTNDFVRYLVETDSLPPTQLVYKRYLNEITSEGINETYKQQLWTMLRCGQFTTDQIEALEFKEAVLLKIVEQYNKCNAGTTTYYSRLKTGAKVRLNIRPGLNYASIVTSNSIVSYGTQDFGNKLSGRLGLEGEFVLPFNKNKWAVIAEMSYQYYKSSIPDAGGVKKADYKYAELAPGVRYYIFLNNKSSLFFNAILSFQFAFNSSIDIYRTNIKLAKSLSVGGGMGFKAKRYGVELRSVIPKNTSTDYLSWNSRYFTTSLVFSYTIFQ